MPYDVATHMESSTLTLPFNHLIVAKNARHGPNKILNKKRQRKGSFKILHRVSWVLR